MKGFFVAGALLASACSPSISNDSAADETESVGAADGSVLATTDDGLDDRILEMPAGGQTEGRELLTIDADDLSAAVKSNQFAAEREYGGRNLIVSARVKAVTGQSGPDADEDQAAIRVDTANRESMEANLLYTEMKKVTNITPNQDVRLLCSGYEYKYYKVILSECMLL